MSDGGNFMDGWREEMRSAYLYQAMAEAEAGSPRAALFSGLAAEAESQAGIWARKSGVAASGYAPDLRARMVAALVRRHGPRPLRAILVAMKVRGLSVYSHASPGHPLPTTLEEVGKRHRGISGGGNLRAAVFGVNDGLISNASLILGVAGLLAGAFSMASGEYVSVRSQREMFEHQIGLERDELAQYPEEEAEELALIYAARGLAREDALKLAKAIIADPAQALDTLAREELGLNPDELGSPWGAAISSFLSFAIGALVPLLPFLALAGERALPVSIAVTGLALFGVGAAISLFTGKSAVRDGLRMLAIGAAAGALTYGIGRLLGVSLS